MTSRPWAQEEPLPCQHSGQPPSPQKAEEAVAVFCQCLQQHVFPPAVEILRAEEDNLRNLHTRIEHIKGDEVHTRQRLQKRLRRVSGILERARKIICTPLPSDDGNPKPQAVRQSNDLEERDACFTSEAPRGPSEEHNSPEDVVDLEEQSEPHGAALSEMRQEHARN